MAAQRRAFGQQLAHRGQEIAPAQAPGFVVVPQGGYTAAQRHAVEGFRRVDFKDFQLARRLFDKALHCAVAGFMQIGDIHQRLQAAVSQPFFHPLKPLWGVIHLRRHGTDHNNSLRPAPRGFLNGYRIADPAIQIVDSIKGRGGSVETRDRAGGAKDIQPVLFLRREVARRVVIAPAGAHPELFSAIEQARRGVHRQRHLASSGI
ncbi:hypothetical protein D3C76_1331460 [compost metagenome]